MLIWNFIFENKLFIFVIILFLLNFFLSKAILEFYKNEDFFLNKNFTFFFFIYYFCTAALIILSFILICSIFTFFLMNFSEQFLDSKVSFLKCQVDLINQNYDRRLFFIQEKIDLLEKRQQNLSWYQWSRYSWLEVDLELLRSELLDLKIEKEKKVTEFLFSKRW